MGALMKGGQCKDAAAREVSKSAQSWPRLSSGIIKAHSVTNWRDEFKQAAKADPSRRQYEHLLGSFSNGPRAKEFLTEVLAKGPPLTGGKRKLKT